MIGRASRWGDTNGTLHQSPIWQFDYPRSRGERIYQTALRIAAWRYIRATPDWSADDALAAAATGFRAEKALATKLVDAIDKLPAEQRDAMANEWFEAAHVRRSPVAITTIDKPSTP